MFVRGICHAAHPTLRPHFVQLRLACATSHVEKPLGCISDANDGGHGGRGWRGGTSNGKNGGGKAVLAVGTMAAAAVKSTTVPSSEVQCDSPSENDNLPPWAWASDACALWRRAWQPDWDGRAPPTDDEGKAVKVGKDSNVADEGKEGKKTKMKPQGRVRHLLFIRHGQYIMDDDEHGLTELGRDQSRHLGKRLAEMSGGTQKDRTREMKVRFEGIWSSDLPRARQTAEILAEYLPEVELKPADPALAEGSPAVPCPQKGRGGVRGSTLWEDSARIEYAFRRYVHRDVDHKRVAEKEAKEAKEQAKRDKAGREKPQSEAASQPDASGADATKAADPSTSGSSEEPEHVFEIIVCHCNVIRYFVMRALQLPPEAWLRLGGYNTGITELVIRPNGSVSLIRHGDTGHLPLNMTTFS